MKIQLNEREIEIAAGTTLFQRGEIPSTEELEALMAARHTPGVHEKSRPQPSASPLLVKATCTTVSSSRHTPSSWPCSFFVNLVSAT